MCMVCGNMVCAYYNWWYQWKWINIFMNLFMSLVDELRIYIDIGNLMTIFIFIYYIWEIKIGVRVSIAFDESLDKKSTITIDDRFIYVISTYGCMLYISFFQIDIICIYVICMCVRLLINDNNELNKSEFGRSSLIRQFITTQRNAIYFSILYIFSILSNTQERNHQ